ncbi:hypothetical protein A9Q94_05725 [Rhodobacterales bacterium 56_14_T64]|nr:hypothetical protein A9Q94_05725 [Rhodobacterales bacterium 56_14_T64]
MTVFVLLLRVMVFAMTPAIVFAGTSNLETPVLLVVEVPDQDGGDGLIAQFTMDDLQALPAVSFETETIWFTGSQRFTGVPLAAVMQQVGITEGTIEASGSDDFSIELHMPTATAAGAIIAYQRNGSPMSVRKKGPLRVVYPFDDFPPLKRDLLFDNTIWHLVRIVVKSDIK